ncbi:MAG: sigma-70 family RNA polymerase sigma factor [Syntrophorhabdaceae bacterium]|nr:sigma-70 family RNA polymerase sigma factor [Syntrophorhabdaceae bacterium]MDD4196188.1 sigma-70 family RNA polymerase sigma factor [Syntrophorhabdaceae bacterium]HOC45260.1 sigma-70 family RNA polymerase sigma factor [Syntrophorhabdaceae bacterium]
MKDTLITGNFLIQFFMREGTKSADRLSHAEERRTGYFVDEDSQYVALCNGGEPRAFEVLVRRHQKKMFNIAYRMTGNYDDAADIVQEAFLSAYKAIKTFRGEAKFSTWLYGIVVNHARNRMRHTNSKAYHEPVSLDVDPYAGNDRKPIDPASDDTPVTDILIQKEIQEKVQKCINDLEKDHREILVLRDIQGFSYEEISIMLGLPDGTVKSRLSRARGAIRESLKKVLGNLR